MEVNEYELHVVDTPSVFFLSSDTVQNLSDLYETQCDRQKSAAEITS